MARLITDDFADSLVSTSRATVGDSLRAVIYFTPDDFDMLYIRTDLYDGHEEMMRKVKSTFVENERVGFESHETYGRLAKEPDVEPDIGEYEFTIRVFSDGFVNRIIVGDQGVLFTTDSLEFAAFEDLAITIRKMLVDPAFEPVA
ncbi:DUF7522 family protein (plasmid) [Haloferacaceae archaeon DSL9]